MFSNQKIIMIDEVTGTTTNVITGTTTKDKTTGTITAIETTGSNITDGTTRTTTNKNNKSKNR